MGTGRRGAHALGLPEFQILHEVFHGHLVQKHKVGLAALRAFIVLHPAGAGSTQARLPQPSCAERLRGGVLSHRPSPPCPQPPRLPPQQCGEVGSGFFWLREGVAVPLAVPSQGALTPASWFPPLRACLTVEVEAVEKTPTLCDLTLTPSRGASAVPGPAGHLWDPEERFLDVVLATKLLCVHQLSDLNSRWILG